MHVDDNKVKTLDDLLKEHNKHVKTNDRQKAKNQLPERKERDAQSKLRKHAKT